MVNLIELIKNCRIMNKYIVVIEFDDLIEVDEKIYDLLCSMGHTEQLTEHSFLVATEQDVVYVRDSIKNSPYDVDSIFVITVESPAAWRKVMSDRDDIKGLLHE